MKYLFATFAFLFFGFHNVSFSEDTPAQTNAMTKEKRETMATLHEKMATCLRSEKTLPECRAEMRKDCQEKMGEEGCGMMKDRMHMRKGK